MIFLVAILLLAAFAGYQAVLYYRVPSDCGAPLFVEYGCAVWSDLWTIHHIDTVVVDQTALLLNDVLGFLAYYRTDSARLHELDLNKITGHGPASWRGISPKPTNYEVRYSPKPTFEITFRLRLNDAGGFERALAKAIQGAPRA